MKLDGGYHESVLVLILWNATSKVASLCLLVYIYIYILRQHLAMYRTASILSVHRSNMRLNMAFVPSALGFLASSTAVAAFQQPLPFPQRSDNAPAKSHNAEYATVLYFYLGF